MVLISELHIGLLNEGVNTACWETLQIIYKVTGLLKGWKAGHLEDLTLA